MVTSGGPVRVGVIGCGAIARREHVPLLQAAGARLTAFASGTRASAEAAAAEAGAPPTAVYDDWRGLAGAADVDAVLIATPNGMHAEQAVVMAQAGKHVLVEKPFTVTLAEADAVLAAAAYSGVVVMTAHNARFAPAVVALRTAIASGSIGAVTSVRATFAHPGVQAYAGGETWFTDPARSGGGALIDLGVHLVDTLRWLLDDDIDSVVAMLSPAQECELDAHLLLETVSGVTGSLHAGWRAPQGRHLSLWLQGETGTLALDGTDVRLLPYGGDPQTLPVPTEAPTVQAVFLQAVRDGVASSPDGTDGRAAVAVVQAAYEAARSGRRTTVVR